MAEDRTCFFRLACAARLVSGVWRGREVVLKCTARGWSASGTG